jgi:PAS domain S-box-containing protein
MESFTKVQLGPALLATALDQCQDAVFVENDQRRLVYANEAACALLGYTQVELLACGLTGIHVGLQDGHATAQWFDGSHARFECFLRTRAGDQIPVSVSAVCQVDDDGLHRVLVARDVSGRDAHLAELKWRDQQLQAILDTFPFLVWWKDPDGVIRVANRQAALWAHQLESQALIGKTDFQVLPADLAQRYAQKDQWVMDSGQVLCAEELYPGLPSGSMWIETWCAPLKLNEELLGTVGFARDITDRKLTEQHLKQTLSLLQGVIDAFPDFLFESNREGRIHQRKETAHANNQYVFWWPCMFWTQTNTTTHTSTFDTTNSRRFSDSRWRTAGRWVAGASNEIGTGLG